MAEDRFGLVAELVLQCPVLGTEHVPGLLSLGPPALRRKGQYL